MLIFDAAINISTQLLLIDLPFLRNLPLIWIGLGSPKDNVYR